jgi:hypothetical protein
MTLPIETRPVADIVFKGRDMRARMIVCRSCPLTLLLDTATEATDPVEAQALVQRLGWSLNKHGDQCSECAAEDR